MGVLVTSLAARADARGSSFNLHLPFGEVGECHIATVRPGAVRGNHYHPRRRELLAVLYSDRWTLLWDDGEGTAVQSRTFAGSGAVLMDADPLCAHAVRNDGAADLQLFVLGDVSDETFRRELTPPLTRIAGLDGCRAGWVAAIKEGDAVETRILHSDEEVLALFAECLIVAIDIPIGLTTDGPRPCDRHARRHLGARASSVFPAPIRPLIAVREYVEANRLSRELQKGKGISKQAWAIVPKIVQIDRLLQRHHELRGRVYEVHPEVSFAARNREALPASKHKPEGLDARRTLVTAHFGELPPVPRGASEDDLLDAFAALWSAERITRNEHGVLGDGHVDVTGLPMRIVY
jgi:predicted RNase H-like nuclease